MDIWTFFTCVGIDILRENAILSFIAPNNWVSNAGASKVRTKILRESRHHGIRIWFVGFWR
jgi:adenine-specific DNA-methyltransferase